jgi:hypothetical protein
MIVTVDSSERRCEDAMRLKCRVKLEDIAKKKRWKRGAVSFDY